jgi:sulfite reductase (ferredoxin)
VADIGLMSALAPRPDGTKSDAFLVHLGGGTGDGESFGRKVKGVRVFAEDAADYIETLVKRYRARRGPEEPSFTDFVRGMDDDELTVFATPEAGR